MHSGAWFANMIIPGTTALLVTGPIGGAAVAGTTALLSANYTRKLKNKVKELVKQYSKQPYTDEKVETFV